MRYFIHSAIGGVKTTEADVAKKPEPASKMQVTIKPFTQRTLVVPIIGTMPLVYNRMSEKAKQTLLMPSRLNRKDKSEEGVKHDPYREFCDSFYIAKEGPTLFKIPASAFKNALETAALDTEGVAKSEVGRCISMGWEDLPVWGETKLFMTGVRQAGMNRTPDIRTRGILTQWVTCVTLKYIEEKFTAATIFALIARAGMMSGVGDFRQEKGAGSFGTFEICEESNPRYLEIVEKFGRQHQTERLADPAFFDDESASLYNWWVETYTKHFGASPKHLREAAA